MDESDLLRYHNSPYADNYPDMKFSDARDLIRNQVLTEKRSQTLRGYLQQLQDRAAIVKHVEPIHAWHDSRHDSAKKPGSQ